MWTLFQDCDLYSPHYRTVQLASSRITRLLQLKALLLSCCYQLYCARQNSTCVTTACLEHTWSLMSKMFPLGQGPSFVTLKA